MPISEPTAVFSIRDDRDMEIKQAVLQVYRALEEKGYNPINQLVGYILSEDPTSSRPTRTPAPSSAASTVMTCCRRLCVTL